MGRTPWVLQAALAYRGGLVEDPEFPICFNTLRPHIQLPMVIEKALDTPLLLFSFILKLHTFTFAPS